MKRSWVALVSAVALVLATMTGIVGPLSPATASRSTADGQPFSPHDQQAWVRDDSNNEAHAISADGTRMITATQTPNTNGCTGGSAPIELISGVNVGGSTTWSTPVLTGVTPDSLCVLGGGSGIANVSLSGDGTRGFLVLGEYETNTIRLRSFVWPRENAQPTYSDTFTTLTTVSDGHAWFDSAAIDFSGDRAVIAWPEVNADYSLRANRYAVFDPADFSTIVPHDIPVATLAQGGASVGISASGSVVKLQAQVFASYDHPDPTEFVVLTCTVDCTSSGLKKFSISVAEVENLTGKVLNSFSSQLTASGTRLVINVQSVVWDFHNDVVASGFAVVKPSETGSEIFLDSRIQWVSTHNDWYGWAVNSGGTRLAVSNLDSSRRVSVTTYDINSQSRLVHAFTSQVKPAEKDEQYTTLSFVKARAGVPERLSLVVEHGAGIDPEAESPEPTSYGYRVYVSDTTKPKTWTPLLIDDEDQNSVWGLDFLPSADGSHYVLYTHFRYWDEVDTYAAHTYRAGAMLKTATVTKQPTIAGTGAFATAMVFKDGAWTKGMTVSSISWMRDSTPLDPQPRGKTYKPRADADMGAKLFARYTLHKEGYFDYSFTIASTKRMHGKPVRPSVGYCCSTGGGITVGQVFTASASATPADAVLVKIEWSRNGKVVGRGETYTAVAADVGNLLMLKVWFSRPYWKTASNGIGVY